MANSRSPSTILKLFVASFAPSLVLDPSEYKYVVPVSNLYGHFIKESGYFHIQATRPDSIGIGLNTSPLGLAAYILEKFAAFPNKENTDFNGKKMLEVFTKDELLNDVMIYWWTGTMTSAMRFYKENAGDTPQHDFIEQLQG